MGMKKQNLLAPPPQSLASSGQSAGNASPLFHINEADDYYNWHEDSFSAFGSSFMTSQKTNDTFVPYWTENEDKPVCITMNDSGFFMWQRIIETLNNFSSNEQVYILILHEENNFDSINSFGGFGGFDTFESDSDKNWKNM